MTYYLAIDQGTTSSRTILYNENFEKVIVGQKEFPQYFPKSGWVEHDADEIWQSVLDSIAQVTEEAEKKSIDLKAIKSIGITNQRETFALWNRSDSKVQGKAVVWQCRRSEDICKKLQGTQKGKLLAKKTGLVLDPYFSGTKLKHRLDENSEIKKMAKKGELAFGTIDSFLIWNLTGGESHVTDVSNASRTMLMDLKKAKWSEEALEILKLPKKILPEIKDSNAHFGVTKGIVGLPNGIPITGVLGDQQAALFGQACFKAAQMKVTYGTGAFLLLNTGESIVRKKGALSTMAWSINGKKTYALEASVFVAGAAVQWLRDQMGFVENASEIEKLASECDNTRGVYLIPAFAGLGSPYWKSDARAIIGGLHRGSEKSHIARACLEGIAHSVSDVVELLESKSPKKLKSLRVDGGASLNELLMQMQSDQLQLEVERPEDIESTARGAAFMAALGADDTLKLSDLAKKVRVDKSWKKSKKKSWAANVRKQWVDRIRQLYGS